MNVYYASNLLIYAGIDIIACLALNLQFGVSGIINFSFIVFQAVGAYAAAILSLPPDTANSGFQHYVGGLQLPFPFPWIGGAVAGGGRRRVQGISGDRDTICGTAGEQPGE